MSHWCQTPFLGFALLLVFCWDYFQPPFSPIFVFDSSSQRYFTPKGPLRYLMAVFSGSVKGIELDVSETTGPLLQKIVFAIVMQISSKLELSWGFARETILLEYLRAQYQDAFILFLTTPQPFLCLLGPCFNIDLLVGIPRVDDTLRTTDSTGALFPSSLSCFINVPFPDTAPCARIRGN